MDEPGDDRPAAGQVRLDHPRRDRLVHERARFHGSRPLADLVHAVPCISRCSISRCCTLRCCARNCRAYPAYAATTHRQSHETLISRNASSTASAQLIGIGRKVTCRARPGWPLTERRRPPAPAIRRGRRAGARRLRHYSWRNGSPHRRRRAIPRRSWRRRSGGRGGAGRVRGGTGGEHAALVALAGARLLVPLVDGLVGDGWRAARTRHSSRRHRSAGGRSSKASEMAMPQIVGRDGRHALPAFTMPGRRPAVAARGPAGSGACGRGVAVGRRSLRCAVVIDIAGPVPMVVEGARLAALAAGGDVPGMHEDPDVWQQVAAAAAEIAPGIRVRLSRAERRAGLHPGARSAAGLARAGSGGCREPDRRRRARRGWLAGSGRAIAGACGQPSVSCDARASGITIMICAASQRCRGSR